MALPIFEEFLYPFLLATSKKDMTSSEMRQYIVDYFHLSDEDCSLRTKSGNSTQVADRLNWVRQYLRRALMLELPERGVYRITQRGKDYLATHNSLTKKDLMEYPEFASYATGSTSIVTSSLKVESPKEVPNEDMTPTEQLEQAYHSLHTPSLLTNQQQDVRRNTEIVLMFFVVNLLPNHH